MVSASTLFASALLALPSVSALGELGFNLGVKRDQDHQCKSTQDFEADFDHLKGTTDTVKVYAASDCNVLQNIAPALESKNFKLFLGVWPDDEAKFELEKQALRDHLPQTTVEKIRAVLVGSESLYRKERTGESLAQAINTVRDILKDIKDKNGKSYSAVPVGTVDSWNSLVDGGAAPAIQAADIVMANAFSYWQGQGIENATFSFFDDIMQALQQVQSIKGTTDVNFWVGETGWPTGGQKYKNADPTLENAKQFWAEGICGIRRWGVNTLVFEAFDEKWKPHATADDGTDVSETEKNWGVLKSDGSPKYDISCKA